MPAIEIMSPLSDTVVPTTFFIVGEDDLPRTEKKPVERLDGFAIKVSYRESGAAGPFQGDLPATFEPDQTWHRELTLTAGRTYDIVATLYQNDMTTNETDQVVSVSVSSAPAIGIDPARLLSRAPAAAFAPAPTGTFTRPGTIFVQIVRFDFDRRKNNRPLKKKSRVVASYHTGTSGGTWHLYDSIAQRPIDTVPNPQGQERTYVVVATLVRRTDWTTLGTATQVLRR